MMPRLLWKDGITSLTNLSAANKVGIMFTVVIVSLQLESREFLLKSLGSVYKLNTMKECFQMLLCYWVWWKKDTYWTQGDKQANEGVHEAIRTMLSRLIELWSHSTGQGWENPKVHKQLHVPDDIERNGCPQGSHSGPTEHNHIALIKKTSKRCTKTMVQSSLEDCQQNIRNVHYQFCIQPNVILFFNRRHEPG